MSFIAISFSKTRCLPDSGFCFTPSEIAFFGASPRRHAPRFHFISEICGTGAGGACGEEETATTNSSLQTTLKTKKECEIALYRHDPERFTKALRPRLPSCHPNDNQYQPYQNPPFGDIQRKAVCYDVVRDKRDEIHLHRHLLLQDPLFTDSGFCFTPSEIAFFGASPRRHAPRFHFISEICGTGAGGACGEEETATMDSSLQTTLKNYQHRLLRSVWIVRMASQISSFFSGMKF